MSKEAVISRAQDEIRDREWTILTEAELGLRDLRHVIVEGRVALIFTSTGRDRLLYESGSTSRLASHSQQTTTQ